MTSVLLRAYRLVLKLYPSDERRAIAPDLVRALEESLEATRDRRGPWAMCTRGLRELWDLALNLAPAWWAAWKRGSETERDVLGGRGGGIMNGVGRELGQTARELLRRKGYSVTVVLTLALGVGANAGVFSLLNGVLFEPLPYPESDRLVYMYESFREDQTSSVAYLNYRDWRMLNESFQDLGARTGWSFTLTGRGDPELLSARLMSANLLGVLGVEPALGRGFTPEDEAREDNVVLLSHGLWSAAFGSDPGVVGQTLTLDGDPYTVVGVLPRDVEFPLGGVEIFAPLTVLPEETRSDRSQHPGISVIGRLEEDMTLEQARDDMDRIGARLAQRYPDTNAENGVRLVPLKEYLVGDSQRVLLLVQGAVALVLLIACANVANLMLVRSVKTSRDAGIRAALGAGRGRILRRALSESLLLALAGAVLGVGLAYGAVELVRILGPEGLPRLHRVGIDVPVLLFSVAVALGAGLLAGLYPAVRTSAVDPAETLRAGGGRGGSGDSSRFRTLLVVGEVALTFILLAGAGLMLRSTMNLLNADPGLRTENVLTVEVPLSGDRFSEVDGRIRFYRTLLEQVRAIPGVESAAGVTPVPMGSSNWQSSISRQGLENVDDQGLRVEMARVTPGYFETMGIPLLRGRTFREDDSADEPLAVIDETLAERLWPGEDPLNRTFRLRFSELAPFRVIGVVGHVKNYGQGRDSRVQMYQPYTLRVWSLSLVVHSAVEPTSLVPSIRRAVSEIDPQVPVTRVTTMAQLERETMASERLTAQILGIFAGVSLVLALVGLYGVVAYSVSLRTREIGIRIALGADARRILGMVTRSGVVLVAGGVALGALGAAAATRSLASLLFEVGSMDPPTLVAVGLILGLVGLSATVIPARRAAAVEPSVALREE